MRQACPKLYAGLKVGQEHLAHRGVLLPAKHGVDDLGQLSPRSLVNAAGIDPGIVEAVLRGKGAYLLNLAETFLLRACHRVVQLLERDFFVFPGVRGDRIGESGQAQDKLATAHPSSGL